MRVGDVELLAASRAGNAPPASVWAVVAALRQLDEAGNPAPKVAEIAERTNLDGSTIHRAREWLDRSLPGWRGGTPAPGDHNGASTNGHRPAVVELAPVAATVPAPRATSSAPAIPGASAIKPSLVWRNAVAERMAAVQGAKTWDLYVDIYGPAADAARDAGGSINDLIALAVHMLETIRNVKVTKTERGRIAQLVRLHGKAVLLGIAEAIPRVADDDVGAILRYATAVCRSTHRKIRTAQQEGATA